MDNILELINEIKNYGIENNVPIMSEDTIEEINKIINDNNVHSVLEIGTAIAYSTICIASNKNINHITSIERDEEREQIAVSNVEKSKLKNIKLIFDDATNVELEEKFDLLIIDAAKSQNKRFFEKYKNNLSENGIIIIDNLSFHGYVGKSSEIKSRNLRQMIRKVEKFIEFLDSNEEFSVEYIEVGDKLGVCKRKN